MKIQIISEFYYPDNFRINDIVKELVLRGNDVKVLTGLPDYATGYVPKKYKRFKNYQEIINGARTTHIYAVERRQGAIRRVMNYGTFMINSALYALFSKKPDCEVILVNETSPIFQLLPGVIWKKRTNKKLIFYCYDLWPESLKAWGISEKQFIYKAVTKFCIWLCKQCDIVAITSSPFQSYLIEICKVNREKIVYLPQYAEDDYESIVSEYEENGEIDFLFAGNIGAVQNVDCIINAIPFINSNKNYMIHIVGNGSELENCKKLAQNLNVEDKVIFHGRHPAEKMIRFYKLADCFLLTLRGGDFIGMTLPAKAQGYLSVGKPIIAAINGAGKELIEQSDCGEVVEAGDYRGLSSQMEKVIDNFPIYKEKGENARRYFEANFTKEIFMNSLMKLLR